jgi:hypothetical protein
LVSVVEVFSEIQSTVDGAFAWIGDGEPHDSFSEEATRALPIPRTRLSLLLFEIETKAIPFYCRIDRWDRQVMG